MRNIIKKILALWDHKRFVQLHKKADICSALFSAIAQKALTRLAYTTKHSKQKNNCFKNQNFIIKRFLHGADVHFLLKRVGSFLNDQ